MRMMRTIYYNVGRIFEIAKRDGIPTYLAADRMAEERIAAIGRTAADYGNSTRFPRKYACAGSKRRTVFVSPGTPSSWRRSVFQAFVAFRSMPASDARSRRPAASVISPNRRNRRSRARCRELAVEGSITACLTRQLDASSAMQEVKHPSRRRR